MRLKETMIKRLFNLYDDIFDKLKLEIYTDESGTIYGKWFDKNEKLIFSRNHFGTLWVDNCDLYTTLWIYSKSVSLNKEEFELSLIDYLNQKYQKQSKNRPIKSIGDEYHCLEDMEDETENLQESIRRILREELDNNSLSTYVRRVVNLTDENIKKILKGEIAYHSNHRLGGESLDRFLQRITFDTAGELTKWFDQEEYDKNFDSVEKYIKDNYTDFIFDYFNETFKEDEESKFCFIKHSERYGGRGFTECTDSWFKFLNKFVSWLPNTDWNKVKEELKTKDRVLLARPLEGHIYEYYFSVLKK